MHVLKLCWESVEMVSGLCSFGVRIVSILSRTA